ncbi:hypothetical protein AN2341V1_4849 [Klebsiella pneumoniae]|uniref:Uncharacterized protein n=1 Tax=Klebsiella quasipneumoniae TaxID=1463165 RepID=A0A6M4NQW0_9ENTR|nr:hypothetical protein [Klebsiella quasipneumoniae]CAF9750066.1 hypothetical protein AN2341V1_4849 [Klebsiella pneumoniae]BBT88027.1 hypothetical protein WP8W19C01_P12410 [Raoultella ornithinolytica]CAH6266877.1 hypothetical protein AI3067V1_5024 [Klebsiella pneumoniae]SAS50524.1 Uncharacterised protein [Klebsiella pneumoniae]
MLPFTVQKVLCNIWGSGIHTRKITLTPHFAIKEAGYQI